MCETKTVLAERVTQCERVAIIILRHSCDILKINLNLRITRLEFKTDQMNSSTQLYYRMPWVRSTRGRFLWFPTSGKGGVVASQSS